MSRLAWVLVLVFANVAGSPAGAGEGRDVVGELVRKALDGLEADPGVKTALHGRRLAPVSPGYFPSPGNLRLVAVSVEVQPRADDGDGIVVQSQGFTDLDYRVDRTTHRIVAQPTVAQARATLERMDATFAVALPLARARFAELPASRGSAGRARIRGTLMCYSGRNDAWLFSFQPVDDTSGASAVTLEVDTVTRRVAIR